MDRFHIYRDIAQLAKSFWRDTDGVILPYVTVMLFVIIGMSLLALDGARYMSLQTQMQAAADALALAGAAELNGEDGARTRATNAINTFISNGLSGMGITGPVSHSAPVFYSSLPAANQLPSSGTVAASDQNARFVSVAVTPVTVPTIFPVPVPGLPNNFSAGARAVAGMNQSFCKIPPVYICNPWEGTGTSLKDALADPAQRRKQIKLLNNGDNGPGHFGWLVPPDGNVGANNLRDWISRTNPKTCYSKAGVDLNTGAKTSALAGFNALFDIGADSDHLPDTNVRKGWVPSPSGDWCNPGFDSMSIGYPNSTTVAESSWSTSNAKTMALPQDSCFVNSSCSLSYMGNGQWDCGSYWDFNHRTGSGPAASNPARPRPSGCSDAAGTTLSRYDIYLQEKQTPVELDDWSRGSRTPAASQWTAANGGEKGAPMCRIGQGVPNQKRRVLPVAVIDCIAHAAEMGAGGQTANNILVAGFAKFFISRPVITTGSLPDDNKLIGEFTGEVTGLDAKIFQNVKLYR